MLFLVEVGMFVFGIMTLVKGRISLSRNKAVTGAPAYVIGALLTATLPVAVLVAFGLGFYLGIEAAAHHRAPPTAMDFIWIDLAAVFVTPLVALVIALATAKPPVEENTEEVPLLEISPLPPETPAPDPKNPYSSPYNP